MTTYQEDQTEHAFDNGDAAFARNWPYQYGIGAGAGSKVKGKFSVTTLPHGASGKSVGTVGGWQLAVSKFSKHQGASIELVRYMTSPAVEKFDAITNSNVPTIVSVAKNKAVVKANPYLKPGHRERCSRDAPREVPRCALQRGLEGRLPGHQPDPHRLSPQARCCLGSSRGCSRS